MKKVPHVMMAMALFLVLVISIGMKTPVAAGPVPKILVMGANTPGSLVYVMAAGFKKVLEAHTSMKVEVFPQATTVYFPMLLSGEVHFGIALPGESLAAYKGEAMYEKTTRGKGNGNYASGRHRKFQSFESVSILWIPGDIPDGLLRTESIADIRTG